MLNKIRTDMSTLFSKNHKLVVNTELFLTECEEDNYYKNVWKFDSKALLEELRKVGVKITFYGSKCTFIKQNLELIKQNGHEVYSSKDFHLNDGFFIITEDLSDKSLITKSEFSVSSPSSPLELKMISSYVSNFDGEYIFCEIGNLLLRCRS